MADAEALHPVLDDPALHRFTGGAPLDRAALAARFARLAAGAPAGSGETWGNWVVRLRDGSCAVGVAQATVRADHALVAWVIGAAWQGRGYATEAATALTERLLAGGAAAVRAHIHPEHVASQRVAEHAGLARTGAVADDGEEVWERVG